VSIPSMNASLLEQVSQTMLRGYLSGIRAELTMEVKVEYVEWEGMDIWAWTLEHTETTIEVL